MQSDISKYYDADLPDATLKIQIKVHFIEKLRYFLLASIEINNFWLFYSFLKQLFSQRFFFQNDKL